MKKAESAPPLDMSQTMRINFHPEEDRRKETGLFRLAFSCAADAMFVLDTNGIIVEANQTACQWFGCSAQEFVGRSPKEFDVGIDVEAAHQRILDERELRFETLWAIKGGDKLPVELLCRLAKLGNTRMVLAIARDISARKSAEATQALAQAELERKVAERTDELLRANEKLREEALERKAAEFEFRSLNNLNETLLATIDALVVVTDQGGRVVRFNRACEKATGWRSEDVVGRCVWDVLVPADHREAARQHFEGLVAGGPGRTTEGAWVTRSGELRWMSWLHSVIEDSAGKPSLVISSGFDLTEPRELERRLKASERKYRDLYESMRDGYVVVDMAGRIQEFNDAYCAMLGYTPDELRRLTYPDITPRKWHELEQRIIETQVLPRGYSDIYLKEYIRKSGEIFPVELRTTLQRDGAGKPAAMWAIVRDLGQSHPESASRAAAPAG